MRRLGLLPRPPPTTSTTATAAAATTTTTTSSSHSPPDTLPEPLPGEENTTSGQPEEQAPPLPQKVPPPPAEPAPEPQAPPPPTPRFSGMMRSLRVRLFSPVLPCSVEAGNPLSAPPSPEDEDDVLLVSLTVPDSESGSASADWAADDEPLLT